VLEEGSLTYVAEDVSSRLIGINCGGSMTASHLAKGDGPSREQQGLKGMSTCHLPSAIVNIILET
jgi:hypothetical protein